MTNRLGAYEITPEHIRLNPEQFASDKAAFLQEFSKVGLDPVRDDTLQAFSAAVFERLTEGPYHLPQMQDLIDNFIIDRPEMTAPNKAQLFWRQFHFHFQRLDQQSARYPFDFDYEVMLARTGVLLQNPSYFNDISYRLSTRNNQANRPERYAGIKLAMQLHGDLLPTKPTLTDAGASAALGAVQLLEEVPFKPIDFDTDPDTADFLRGLHTGRLALARCVAFDAAIIDGPALESIESDSYYPRELLQTKNTALIQDLRALLHHKRRALLHSGPAAEQNRFEMILANLLPDEQSGADYLEDVRALSSDGKFSVASAVTAVYGITPNDIPIALHSLKSLARDLVIVQDFAHIDDKDPTQLEFPGIYATPYKTFVQVLAENDDVWHEVGTWDGGRCKKFTPSPYTIDLCRRKLGKNALM